MKIELNDLSGLPEGLQSVVETEGDKHSLDLSKLALQSDLEKFKAQKLKAENESIDRRKALTAWKELGETPEEVRAKIENASKGGNEDHERIVTELKTSHEAARAEDKRKYDALLSRTTASDLKAELAKAGVVSEGLDLLANFASARIQHDDDGNLRILADDGKTPMVGSAPNGGATLADLASSLAKTIPHLVKDEGKGGGGKQPGSQGGTPAKTVTRAEWDQMSHPERATFSKDGGKVTD